MAQLALEAPGADLLARVVVERGGMQRVGDTLDDRLAQLLSFGAQQPAGGVRELLHREPLPLDRGTERARVAAAGEHVVLR